MQRRASQLGVGVLDLTDREKANVNEALENGRLSYGPFSRQFEKEFAKAHECDHAIFVNSGTSALSIAIACLKELGEWQDGDEVIVPASTFVATSNVVLEHHLVPVFVDCDPKTYNINPELIKEKITERTRAIMPVHLYGLMADMDPILEIAKKHDLRVIEDSCETMGVNYKGHKAGSFGDISCFSTYVAHLIVTGVGGLAVTKNENYAEIMRSLANHGRDNIYVSIDDDKDIDGSKFHDVIRRRFRFIRRGYSLRATELEAAIGVVQLERLPEMLSKRLKNAQCLIKNLTSFERWLQLPSYDSSMQGHAFMMFPIVICEDAAFTKEELVCHLEDWNIETREMMPLINQPVYEFMDINPKDYPVADWVNRYGFYIGCHTGFSSDDLGYIAEVFRSFFVERNLIKEDKDTSTA